MNKSEEFLGKALKNHGKAGERFEYIDSKSRENTKKYVKEISVSLAAIAVIVYFAMDGKEMLEALMASSSLPKWAWLLICCALYAVILMVPFAPGLELGLLIMAMFGIQGILGAWLATIIGLGCAFCVGQISRHGTFIETIRQRFLNRKELPKLIISVKNQFARFPYFTLAILINIPGNIVIGGGGGIALSAGALGNLNILRFIVTVALASSIVPVVLIGMFVIHWIFLTI
jgi:hypothetical protein